MVEQASEGESIGNSLKFSRFMDVFIYSRVMLRWQQEMQKPRKAETVVAAVDNFDFAWTLISRISRIEHATSWSDVDQQVDEYGDDDEEHYEVDVECHIGDDDELVESAYTEGLMKDDPELLEQFDGHVEGADASTVYASASRSFQEARELLSRVESASGYSFCWHWRF